MKIIKKQSILNSTMRLLVAEDDQKIAKALQRGFENESFAVDVVHDGEQAIIEATNEPYDVIVLDWMMPEKDGPAVIRQLREQSISTPILMLTARDTLTDKVNGLNHGADDYLVKPFSFDELLARVRALLRRPTSTLHDTLTYDDIVLDSTSLSVSRSEKTIDLSRKEFALLELFMRNPEQILSKETIIRKVWDFDADILPNTVEVYVGYLRSKLDKPFNKQTFKTVRGFGYKMEA